MGKSEKKAHPYIPNSVPEVKAEMLEEIGVKDIDELYEDIPENLRFKRKMDLPEAFPSEYALKKHVRKILSKNQTSPENDKGSENSPDNLHLDHDLNLRPLGLLIGQPGGNCKRKERCADKSVWIRLVHFDTRHVAPNLREQREQEPVDGSDKRVNEERRLQAG